METVIGLMILVAGSVFVWLRKKGRVQREQILRGIATEHAFDFEPEAPDGFLDTFAGLELFDRDYPVRASHLLLRETTTSFIYFFDYELDGQADDSVMVRSVMVLNDPALDVPAFMLRPQSFAQFLSKLYKGNDINFKEHQLFSSEYILRGPNEERIRALFAGELAEYFAENVQWRVECNGANLLIHYSYGAVSEADYPRFVSAAVGLSKRIRMCAKAIE